MSEKRRMTAVEPTRYDRITGCLLGGAIGDALGAPVEFWSYDEIVARVGVDGVRSYIPTVFESVRGIGLITDDTQMTLFTTEGLLRSFSRFTQRGMCHVPGVVHHAYQRWLTTQELAAPPATTDMDDPAMVDGWLGREDWLYSRRAPGNTCLSALREARSRRFGMPAVNDSKGCGAVMRSAPFALMGLSDPGALAAESAALTHGHPSSSVASGALAVMVDALIDGRSLRTAVTAGRDWAERQEQPQEVCRSLDAAVRAADTHELPARVLPTLGEGWIAEEALAIAVFSALRHPEPSMVRDALSLAVTHSGDSDSTGAICGNLVGAAHGADALPGDLVADVEGREAIVQLATDLWIAAEAPERLTVAVAGVEVILDEGWVARYPGW